MQSRSKASASAWTAAFGLTLIATSLTLSLGSYKPEDPSFSSFSSVWRSPHNVLGYLGSWSADIFFQLLGTGAWLLPLLLAVALGRWVLAAPRPSKILNGRWWIGLSLLLTAHGLFFDLFHSGLLAKRPFPPQGLFGIALGAIARPFFGSVGSYLVVAALVWSFCMVWWEELPGLFVHALLSTLHRLNLALAEPRLRVSRSAQERWAKLWLRQPKASVTTVSAVVTPPPPPAPAEALPGAPTIRQSQPAAAEDAPAAKPTPIVVKPLAPPRPAHPTHWQLPPTSLLEYPKKRIKGPSQDQLLETARKITNALKSFEIEGEVVEISPGPILTSYEFQPAAGVRVQKIMSASTDLAMTLGVGSVRIVAPIPGKSVAGIEVPNPDREDIVLRDVFEATLDKARGMRLPLVLGRDGEGRPVMEDLSRMPHLLVGGATSMGKSVLVNSILTSLLCRFSPEDLKLVIVDPKLVEFKVFEDIPHLLLPIVNDPNDASQALKWAVAETKRRYVLMQKFAAKNLEAYNQKVSELHAQAKADGKDTEELPQRFAYIVIIIDELAELMLTAKKDVEQSIVRLTQLARAAGLHLIMATQRPSADVVTGLIKSNCPSRAALRVASSSDSRIILDCTGAEQLLGKGDMFFTNTGPMGLRRMQSCFVSDGEIEKVCSFWRSQGEPEYKDEILAPETTELEEEALNSGELDALYKDVLDFAREKGKVSTSLIQRRFQIGYTRAARIMEQLERNGVVGEQTAAGKPRDVVL